MQAYYNEHDPFAAAWLRKLINADLIAQGDVDERSIKDVRPDDLVGYRQVHLFAGIGGWSYALRIAGIPDDYPVWTGSCPCQPFSAAGAGGWFDDPRHLWPCFAWLICQRRPSIVFGEQVASKPTGPWFDLIQADLEAMDYAFGVLSFPAASVGAPHIRQRAYFCAADADSKRPQGQIQRSPVKAATITSAWSFVERIHATSTWPSWVSESGASALVDGAANRVGRLRGYGNAIVPQQAAEFVRACVQVRGWG